MKLSDLIPWVEDREEYAGRHFIAGDKVGYMPYVSSAEGGGHDVIMNKFVCTAYNQAIDLCDKEIEIDEGAVKELIRKYMGGSYQDFGLTTAITTAIKAGKIIKEKGEV